MSVNNDNAIKIAEEISQSITVQCYEKHMQHLNTAYFQFAKFMYGTQIEYNQFFKQRELWSSILNHIIEERNTDDISYESLQILQTVPKNNIESQSTIIRPKPNTFSIQKINVTGEIYKPSQYLLFQKNDDYWSLNNEYIIRITYSEPLILSDLLPYKVNIAMLFYCKNNNVLIYRTLMDITEKLSKVQLIGMRDIWESFNITVDGDILKWYAFSVNMNKIWSIISYQCYNNEHIACVSNLDMDIFGVDETATRFVLIDMDVTLCNQMCQFYSYFAVSTSNCYCDNGGDALPINTSDVILNSFCRKCTDYNDVDFCGDELRNIWSIYKVKKLNSLFPASFTITKTDQNIDKGQYKVPVGYKWKSNATDINCWKFEWNEFIAYTMHYKTVGLVDRRIGERIVIYHQQTGTLLKVIPLSHNNDDQITDVIHSTLPTSISIEYRKNHRISYSFSDIFSIPSAYIQSIMSNYLGCYLDREDNGDMFLKIKESTMMTYEDCNSQCASKSFGYLGLRYDISNKLQQCFCGFHYGSFGSLVLDSCNYFCQVSPQYRCGSKLYKYRSQKVLSIYSTILPSDSENTPLSIIMSQNHIFEGYWIDTTSYTTHQICQWNNDYIIQSILTNNTNKIATIEMLHTPKLHQCDNNNAQFVEKQSSYHLSWIDGDNWTKQDKIRYILPSLTPYTLYALPIIYAEAIAYDEISDYLSPRYEVTIAHQGFAKEILTDNVKYELTDAEQYREMIELLYDPKKSNKRDPFKSFMNKISFGLFEESDKNPVSDSSLAQNYDFASPFNKEYFNKNQDKNALNIRNLLQLCDRYDSNKTICKETWEFIGRIIGSDYYEMDAYHRHNDINHLNEYYCDEVQREQWIKYNHRIINSLSYIDMIDAAICMKDNIECNLIGVMLDIDTNGDIQAAKDLVNWLDDDNNLIELDSHFALNSYEQLGWDWYIRPFALRNKAIFQIIADAVPTFEPTTSPLPLKNYETVLELYGILQPILIETYMQNAPIFEIIFKDILIDCIKSETIRIRKISITNNNTGVQFDPNEAIRVIWRDSSDEMIGNMSELSGEDMVYLKLDVGFATNLDAQEAYSFLSILDHPKTIQFQSCVTTQIQLNSTNGKLPRLYMFTRFEFYQAKGIFATRAPTLKPTPLPTDKIYDPKKVILLSININTNAILSIYSFWNIAPILEDIIKNDCFLKELSEATLNQINFDKLKLDTFKIISMQKDEIHPNIIYFILQIELENEIHAINVLNNIISPQTTSLFLMNKNNLKITNPLDNSEIIPIYLPLT
eukprot:482610_1